ncbi:unnamed protein product [Linum tenue]|uniref:Reverse transcriptase zinc-binding domain-containing protein n=1 Tax=Linum tenue TaxID=586396 RepID=A0AAV0RP93_9ROSI|nr:unnamed protein product [Linum tenue]
MRSWAKLFFRVKMASPASRCGDIFSSEVWRILRTFIPIARGAERDDDMKDRIRRWAHSKPNSPPQWCSFAFLHAFCWNIWYERNSRTFKDSETTIRVVAYRIGRVITHWLSAARVVDRRVAESWLYEMKTRLTPPRSGQHGNQDQQLLDDQSLIHRPSR